MILDRPNATIRIDQIQGRNRIRVEPRGGAFIARREWETRYTVELIEHVLDVKGEKSFLDEIARDESPDYVEHHLRWDLFSYDPPDSFAGMRVLDFGSGAGASTVVLARLLPAAASIETVELLPKHVELARHRGRFYDLGDRVRFHLSPDPLRLPEGLGEFDVIVLSAVYEHLLPVEREQLLPTLWSHLKVGGTLFIDQTPYRWFPVETHTTAFPLLNYLPDRLALRVARLHPRVARTESWESLLRRGIRGGVPEGIVRQLGPDAQLREPTLQGCQDRIDLWYHVSAAARWRLTKRTLRSVLRVIRALTGVTAVPSLSLAIRKRAIPSAGGTFAQSESSRTLRAH